MASTQPTSSSPWEPPLPEDLQRLLPQYEITGILGRGGMGAVYKGRQVKLNRTVAIKLLPETFTKGEDELNFAKRFEQEAQAMANLDHPAILSVHDFGETAKGQLYFVMEFIDGMDIHQYLLEHGGKLPQEHALSITAHVLDALEYAHSKGIVHRDIKPANILLNREGRVKVADFGLAKKFGAHADENAPALTMSNVAVGTPDFVAPEALDGDQTPDHRADLYAVGVMLYQMLTGKLPRGNFRSPSELDARIDARLDEIVSKAMEADPDHRYQSAAAVRADLDVVLSQPLARVEAGEASGVVAAVVPVKGRKAAKENSKLPVYLGGGIAAAVVVGIVVLVTGGAKEEQRSARPPLGFATKDKPFENSLGMKFVPVPGTEVLFCIHEVRYRDFAEYAKRAKETVDGGWKTQTNDGFETKRGGEDHPVTRVSWFDAQKFCAWLSEKDGVTYRLPTDREWSLAVGIGDQEDWDSDTTPESVQRVADAFPWGDDWPPPKGAGNYSDASRKAKAPRADATYVDGYDDSVPTTAPVMSFAANKHGIFDLGGNVWEWIDDWYSDEKKYSVLRGGSWDFGERGSLLSSHRGLNTPLGRYGGIGFRVVVERAATPDQIEKRSVPPSSTPATAKLSTPDLDLPPATKDSPFENSLGMKFVPVPGTDVLFCIHEVRFRDYDEYAKKAKENVEGSWKTQTNDGFEIEHDSGDHPVTRVNWDDAQAFCKWLSEREGRTYRLPTDREWSLAVGIGRDEDWNSATTPATVFKVPDVFPWGDEWPPPKGAGNYSDESRRAKAPRDEAKYIEGGYDDGFPTTAPVMSFEANQLGLFDLGGNVWEWCEDLYSVEQGDRVLRGGSWDRGERGSLLSSGRYRLTPDYRYFNYGFRVVLAVASGPAPVSSLPPVSRPVPPRLAPDPALARALREQPLGEAR